MTNPNDTINPQLTYEQRGGDTYQYTDGGLTKREYFAAMAMQGMLSNDAFVDSDNDISIAWIGVASRRFADALIAELNKEVAS